METKLEVTELIGLFERHYLQRMTYKYYSQSFKIYNSYDIVQDMYEAIRFIAEKNGYRITKNVHSTYQLVQDGDYFADNMMMINSNWNVEGFKQLSSTLAIYSILVTIHDQLKDDLTLVDKGYLTGILEETNRSIKIKQKRDK